jgi:transcription-repair coupling factor (superfamily II helicase)
MGRGTGTFAADGTVPGCGEHIAAAIQAESGRPILFVTHSERRAREAYDNLRFFLGEGVFLYPSRDTVFYQADVKSARIARERMSALAALCDGDAAAVVLSVEALMDRITPRGVFETFILSFEPGDRVPPAFLAERLVLMGYERREAVEGPGQFAARGGIFDLYPPTMDAACRIEFWDDEIDSIRLMDTDSQRSIEKIGRLTIYPMRELVYEEDDIGAALEKIRAEYAAYRADLLASGGGEAAERLDGVIMEATDKFRAAKNFSGAEQYIGFFYGGARARLLGYLPAGAAVFIDEPARVKSRAQNAFSEFFQSFEGRVAKGAMLPSMLRLCADFGEITAGLSAFPTALLTGLSGVGEDFRVLGSFDFGAKPSGVIKLRVDLLIDDLKAAAREGESVVILAGARTRAERLAAELNEAGVPSRVAAEDSAERAPVNEFRVNQAKFPDEFRANQAKFRVLLSPGSLSAGFGYPLLKLRVISDKELFGTERQKKRRARKNGGESRVHGARIGTFADLKAGDYVVHDSHGIGIYKGIEKIMVDGVSRDYLKIGYQGDGNLYVGASQLDVLQKYIGGDDSKPKLSKLGGQDWVKAKARVRAGVADLARELVELYARRGSAQGYSYGGDTVWQREFEEMFPYDETDDQLAAIEDVKEDMRSAKPMDRLICGDVGYGKTEIAIRAAFKAAQDGMQTAFLVPTTILAQQHYNTLVSRMKDYPVVVESLSRFRTDAEQKAVAEGLRRGGVDIVVGTHRLLSKDISFRRLGLVVVDEEQRFGVKHKERLKALKENTDVLTLTATPIPRTLHMSLTGIRDMSILSEPPQERQPIQTYVMEYSEESARDAILRELSRGGQVYYLHNRVRTISDEAARVSALVPEARVRYAHGQMSERELEDIMSEFIAGEVDVLVCTTIVETGLDIPNVNTIIITDADRMGLAQLYQLRGRVGRSSREAYAYLCYKRDKLMSEAAEKRLQTIREFTEFGSGFKIAMRDLEIRGAGNILGGEQHGHMDVVGYDMYCKLLAEAVALLKGEPPREELETNVDIALDAFIPGYYVESEERKLELYKKISLIETREDYYDAQEEIEDRYGDLPKPVRSLLTVSFLRATARSVGAVSVAQKKNSLIITFRPEAPVDASVLSRVVPAFKGRLLFTAGASPYLTLKFAGTPEDAATEAAELLLAVKRPEE